MKLNDIKWRIETILRYRIPGHIKRLRDGLAYATGRQTPEQAMQMLWDCQRTADCYCLESLDIEGVLREARDRWAEHPRLEELCVHATRYVARKWSSDGELASAARDWALSTVAEDAKSEGVTLVELDELDELEAA